MALDWSAEILRVSLFSTDMVTLTAADWKTITGQDEAEIEQKVVARRTFSGPFLGGQLNVSAVGPRIDCILTPKPPTEAITEPFVPSVGSWPEARREFLKATQDWVGGIQVPVIRIAFGTTLLAQCADREAAYKALLGLLKSVQGDHTRMREMLFRINWPVNSKAVNDLLLNRITNWSVLQIHLQLMIQTDAKPLFDDLPTAHVVRLEMDHNTDAERTEPFDPNRLIPIYTELSELALENAEQGELP